MKANMKSRKLELIESYEKCSKLANKLDCQMQELGRIATYIYGKKLRADICAGCEIEFRTEDEYGFVDANRTILIEEILSMQ